MTNEAKFKLCLAQATGIVAAYRAKAHGDPQNTSAALAVGIAGLAISAGATAYSIASAPGQPTQPNLASANRAVSNASAQLLPVQRQMEALAQQGGSGTVDLPWTEHRQVQVVQIAPGIQVPYNPADWTAGGKYARLVAAGIKPNIQTTTQAIQHKTMPVDFTGVGSADVQGAVASQMAKAQLALSGKYDPQYIAEALREEQLADPQGFDARAKESELIQKQINNPPGHPVADLLQSQVQDRLKAAQSGHLSADETGNLNDAVNQALAARGGASPAGDFERPLVTGYAGEKRLQDAAGAADQWLASGQTPEDVDYRRNEQNIANLSAEINGATPQSEFKSISSGGAGPVQLTQGQPMQQLQNPGNAGAAGATQAYGTTVNNSLQQVPTWTTGITSALNLAGLASSAGWKPLAPTPTPGG